MSGVVAIPPQKVLADAAFNALHGDLGKPIKDALNAPLFGPNVDASLNNPAAQNETTIAINPENSQQIIGSGNDYRANLQPWVYLSTDGGTVWTNYQVPGTSSLFYGDPAMAFGTGGRAYFSYLGYQQVCAGAGGMYVSRSTDAGAAFSAPITLAINHHDGQADYFQDKEYVAVDHTPGSPYNGNVYVAWTTFVSVPGCNTLIEAPIVLSRSTDNGLTWTQPITASQPISNNNQAAQPVIGRHGEVYLYYLGAQTPTQPNYDTVLFSRSTDGGQTFPFFTHIASMRDIPSPLPHSSFRDWGAGAMAGDQTIDGYLYAVWADYRTGDADILLSRSTDNGTTWSAPQRVNDDPVSNGKDQFFPWIATSPDGTVHVSWFDRREDPNGANYKEYYTYSTDHGATFAANIAVSTAPSVPGTLGFIGDYSGIDATNGAVIPIWTDIRTGGNQNAYIAVGQYPPSGSPTPTFTPSTTTPTIAPSSTSTIVPSLTSTTISTSTPIVTYTTTPCPITFSDVHPSDYFYVSVQYLACHGVISGYADGTFRPFNNTTRGQLTKIVVLAEGWTQTCTSQTFSDVPPSHTFYCYVETAVAHGIISGYADGTFKPGNDVTRGQLAKIVVLAEGWADSCTSQHFSDVPPTHPFYCYVETAFAHGIISGYADGTFRPGNSATRGQISKIVYEAITQP
jgi:hypothetical protein